MNKYYLFIFTNFLLISADLPETRVMGTWLTADNASHITIYKSGTIYEGKITWVMDSMDPATGKLWLDVHNPEPSLRSRPIKNLVIMRGFMYNPKKNVFTGGLFYNPRDGKTYRGKLWLSDDNTLQMRGYILFFYQTDEWKRVR